MKMKQQKVKCVQKVLFLSFSFSLLSPHKKFLFIKSIKTDDQNEPRETGDVVVHSFHFLSVSAAS
jgi:hypothetical protein